MESLANANGEDPPDQGGDGCAIGRSKPPPDKLFREYESRVFRFIHSRIQNDADAWDLTQQTFLNAVRSFDSLDDRDPWPWLCTIAANCLREHVRKQRRLKRGGVTELFRDVVPSAADGPLESAITAEQRETVKAAIRELGGDDQLLINRYYYERRSLDEIASELRVNKNTVNSRLSRARKKLGVILKKRCPDLLQSSSNSSNNGGLA